MRKCSRCRKKYPLDQFGKDRSTRDGLALQCKPCRSEYHREHYKVNSDALKARQRKYYEQNRQRISSENKNRRKSDTEWRKKMNSKCQSYYQENKELARQKELLRRYGLTIEEHNALLKAQNNRCSVCKIKFGSRTPVVDHDHETGVIRGLLCNRCNRAIGLLRDDPDVLRSAVLYLDGCKAKEAK